MTGRFASRAAIGALATTLLIVGCKPGGQGRVASASAGMPSAKAAGAEFAAMGVTAMRNRNAVLAVAMAERAVAVAPEVAPYRAQLGQSYLLAGRFASAVDAFRDAATVAPGDGRVLLGMALAQAALDRQDAARAAVLAADGRIGAADRGLALALAGDGEGAIALLEPAARLAGALPRTRQNLALAYALAGRWDEARRVAAQDLPADRIDARMQAWAALAASQPRVERVAAFLGVTAAAEDRGMPVQLALATDPAAPAVPAAPVAVALAPPTVPVVAVVPDREPEPASVTMVTGVAAGTPPLLGPAPAPVPVPSLLLASRGPATGTTATRRPVRVMPPALLMRAAYVRPVPRRGQWAVQLGAFSGRRSIDDAWGRVSRTVRPVAGMIPMTSTVRTHGVLFQRLAVGGLATRAEAVTLCERVRAARGVCFVRATAGEAPVRMAARGAVRMQLASR